LQWNSAVWAEQGFVVIQPNPTGSVGFGKKFRAGVYNNWGGRPYQDLVNCMDHLKKVPYLDHDRAVLAGASYGGYMVNWINGHPLAKRFKASVCHDGIFNVPSFVLQTDEAPGKHDFGGVNFPWANWEGLDKWNPGRPDLLKEWKHAPPCLVVHSDSDYRCPVGEGWAAFKTLQSLGVHSRFLNFPDEGHFVLDPENALVWWREILGWMERWIGKPGGIERERN
jgi:dipeptidyl aminopeptidase/acylaminoacyl peptidase